MHRFLGWGAERGRGLSEVGLPREPLCHWGRAAGPWKPRWFSGKGRRSAALTMCLPNKLQTQLFFLGMILYFKVIFNEIELCCVLCFLIENA